MNLLYALERLRTPFWDAVFSAVTHLGEETVFMVAAILIFWCVSKQEGYYLLLMGFFGTVVNQFLKLLFRIPRPWVRDPDFTIVESARAQATGYSFPSGHTQNAVATFGGIANGTYYLEETKAPAGYNQLTAPVEVKINGGTTEADLSVTANVANSTGTLLPSTGGMGTTVFYVLGAVLVLGAVVLLVTKKRMSDANR